MYNDRSIISLRSRAERVTRGALLCVLGLAGCATSPELDEGSATDLLHEVGDTRSPSGSYFVSVKANGTGCPRDSVQHSVGSDGLFTTTFSQFEVRLDPSQKIALKDCQLEYVLRSPGATSFAVEDVRAGGFAILEEGVSLRGIASVGFGSPEPHAEATYETKGPHDDTFLFGPKSDAGELAWSPCTSKTNIFTRFTLRLIREGESEGTGYANIDSIPVYKIHSRPCSL